MQSNLGSAFEGIGVGANDDGSQVVEEVDKDDVGQLMQKANLATKPIIIMMTSILIARAADKLSIPVEDVFVGGTANGEYRQKLAKAAKNN